MTKKSATILSALLTVLMLAPVAAIRAQGVDPNSSDSDSERSIAPSVVEDISIETFTPLGDWNDAGTLHTARSRTGMAFSPRTERFYVLGGEASGGNRDIPIEEYNPNTNSWRERASLLTGVSNTGAAAVRKFIYVPGGWNGIESVTHMQRYNPVTNNVVYVAPLLAANSAHAVVARGTRVHVLGGSSTGMEGTTHLVYNTKTNTWSERESLPVAVQYPAAASDGKFVYVLGGNTTDLTTVQRYNPATNQWTVALAPMDQGRGGPGAFFDGTNIWAIGGGWATYHTSTESYHPASDVWSDGPTMDTGARTLGVAFGNHLAVKAGGWNGGYLATAERLEFVFHQPDGRIKAPRSRFRGDDIYNRTGKRQIGKTGAARGTTKTFRIKLQNDGNVPDQFRVKGGRGNAAFGVVYLEGTRNITKRVVAGRFRTRVLQPGRTQLIKLKVTVLAGASVGTVRTWKILARSGEDGSARDAVKARVRVI